MLRVNQTTARQPSRVHVVATFRCRPMRGPLTNVLVAASSKTDRDPDQAARDNRSNQLNPYNPNYQGGSTSYRGTGDKADLDNRSNQLNPNHPAYQRGKDDDDDDDDC